MTASQWIQFGRRTAISGAIASGISALFLFAISHRETGSAAAAINGSSQLFNGDLALRKRRASLRYTLPGLIVHHASAHWWAAVHEHPRVRRALRAPAVRALVVMAAAAVIDYGLLPRRLTPGIEGQLSRGAVGATFGAIASGLALGSWLQDRPPRLSARMQRRLLPAADMLDHDAAIERAPLRPSETVRHATEELA